MGRPPNKKAVSVTITPSGGQWVAFVPVGRGKPRRKRSATMCQNCRVTPNVKCQCYKVCEDRVRELEDQVAAKKVAAAGRAQTLGAFLDGWLIEKADHLEYQTVVSYTKCVRRLTPIAGIPVRDLDNTDISETLRAIAKTVSANEAHKVWRTLRSALSDYQRLHPEVPNMAKLVKPARVPDKEIVPFTVEEARRLMEAIGKLRMRVRWFIAIALGLRQGEALALTWSREGLPGDIDLEAGTLTVREKQYRAKWQHGCDDPHACGARLHKTTPCPQGCTRHTRACPAPCPVTCTEHASACPQRHGGGLVKGEPKNRKRRTVALPPTILAALREWWEQQERDRKLAGSKWVDSGRVFTDAFGRPVDARRDWGEWKRILADAGLRNLRVHDARHTAATFNKALNVDPAVRQEIMGWSSPEMRGRYEHQVSEMHRDAAARMDALLWPATTVAADDLGTGSATAPATTDGAKILQFRRKAV